MYTCITLGIILEGIKLQMSQEEEQTNSSYFAIEDRIK